MKFQLNELTIFECLFAQFFGLNYKLLRWDLFLMENTKDFKEQS